MTELNNELKLYLGQENFQSNDKKSLIPPIKTFIGQKFSKLLNISRQNENSNTSVSPKESSSWRLDRWTIWFMTYLFAGFSLVCFLLAGFCIPFLILKIRKFCLLITLGNLFMQLSFVCFYGPIEHVKQLFSPDKRLLTVIYIASIFAVLYSAIKLQSTVLTLLFIVIQLYSQMGFLFKCVFDGKLFRMLSYLPSWKGNLLPI